MIHGRWNVRILTRTVCELVDVLVEFVLPSESGVTYLSNPRKMTTKETVFSICQELILISIQHLPYCGVTCASSAGPMTVLSFGIPIGLRPCASLVLVYSLQIVVIPQISNSMDGSVTNVCQTETVIRNPASLETSPKLQNSGRRWVASRSRVAPAMSR